MRQQNKATQHPDEQTSRLPTCMLVEFGTQFGPDCRTERPHSRQGGPDAACLGMHVVTSVFIVIEVR